MALSITILFQLALFVLLVRAEKGVERIEDCFSFMRSLKQHELIKYSHKNPKCYIFIASTNFNKNFQEFVACENFVSKRTKLFELLDIDVNQYRVLDQC